jgi:PmbA protein
VLYWVLRRAAPRGATAADGFLVEESHFSASVRMREIENINHSREQRLSLRVFAGRASAAASTSDLSRESLERVVDEATALAKITAEDPHAGLPDASTLIARVPDLDLEDAGGDLSPEEKIEIARRAEAAALESDPRVTNSEGAEYSDRRARYAYATSHGFAHDYGTTGFSISVSPIASLNGEMQRDYWYSSARKRARLEDPEAVGRKAAARAVRRLGARKMKSIEVPVVFDPETAASLVRSIAGAASGPSLYRRASFLLDRLGTKIAAPTVTIVDDALIPSALGSRPFDGEGLPTRTNVPIEKGVLKTFLCDSYAARKIGGRATGVARRGIAGGPGVGASNLYFAAGTTPPADIVGEVDRGLFVTDLIGFGVDLVSGDFSQGAAGHWIEKGRFVHPVHEVTIAGNLKQMLMEVDALGTDLVFRGATASPTLRLRKMTISGR